MGVGLLIHFGYKCEKGALAMNLSAEQLEIASRIDAKVERLAGEGNDDVAIFVELAEHKFSFRVVTPI